jgi:hypothetical protein
LGESKAFKEASWSEGHFQGYRLYTGADDPTQSTEGEILKAQERIAAKVFDRKRGPIKFPELDSSIHMVMVDARGFGGDGHGQEDDCRQISHGPQGLNPSWAGCWTDPNTGVRSPIRGLFERECPLSAASILRNRVHVLGFLCERTFAAREIGDCALYLCNPWLVENEAKAHAIMRRWPLRPAMTPERRR